MSTPRLEAAVNLLVGIKHNYGGVRTALKASIAVVHQLKSQIPFFIPVNQTSQGLKCLTQPGDSAVRHCWGCGGGGSDLKRQIELFHCTKYRHWSRSGVYCRMKNLGDFHWNMKPFFAWTSLTNWQKPMTFDRGRVALIHYLGLYHYLKPQSNVSLWVSIFVLVHFLTYY